MFILSILLCILCTCVYLLQKRHHSYWIRRGVPQLEPSLFVGDYKEFVLCKMSITESITKIYSQFKSKGVRFGGFYQIYQPGFMVIDLDLVKSILVKDFGNFVNRGHYSDEKSDPLTRNLFSMRNEEWKRLRMKLSPAFSTARMKSMFPIVNACGDDLRTFLKQTVKPGEAISVTNFTKRYMIDITGSVAFGIDCKSLTDTNSEFFQVCNNEFRSSFLNNVRRFVVNNAPKAFVEAIGIRQNSYKREMFFQGLVRDIINFREENSVYRKDLMHLMLQLKNKGKATDDGDFTPVEQKDVNDKNFISFDEIVGQCYVFFGAGFETLTSGMTFCLLELAKNPDIQQKVQDEIRTILVKHDNQINYEMVKDMEYLEKVIDETLRLYPPGPVLFRVASGDYKVPGSSVVLEKDTMIIIPVAGIHRDPDIYPDPEVFDPERFSEENRKNQNPMAFIPFGEGPRICTASRFAMLILKVAIMAVLRDYSVTLNSKTKLPIKYDRHNIITLLEGGLWLNLIKANEIDS